jgi:hypothetical protein
MADRYEDIPTLAQVRQMFTQLVGNQWPFGADLYEIVQVALDGDIAMQSPARRVPGIWLVHRNQLIVDKRHAAPLRAANELAPVLHVQLYRTHALPRLLMARPVRDNRLMQHDAWMLLEDARGRKDPRFGVSVPPSFRTPT